MWERSPRTTVLKWRVADISASKIMTGNYDWVTIMTTLWKLFLSFWLWNNVDNRYPRAASKSLCCNISSWVAILEGIFYCFSSLQMSFLSKRFTFCCCKLYIHLTSSLAPRSSNMAWIVLEIVHQSSLEDWNNDLGRGLCGGWSENWCRNDESWRDFWRIDW